MINRYRHAAMDMYLDPDGPYVRHESYADAVAEIATLTAECDEYKRRLAEVLSYLQSQIHRGMSPKAIARHGENGVSAVVNAREMYTRAKAIAEGEA